MASRIGLLALSLAFLACSDGRTPTEPAYGDGAPSEAQFGKRAKTGTTSTATETTSDADYQILERVTPLEEPVVRRQVMGPAGGVIRTGTGLRLRVPEGALNKEVRITVTALAGSKMAFDLQPHGLRFKKTVRVGIRKDMVQIPEGSDVVGVYFDGDPNGKAKLIEFFTVKEDDGHLVLGTTHFSGYALASGSRKSRSLDQSF